mmetsp:Transcript_94500/g.173116  ORF Transcript_94500/g.173116 Transcript_94500/m.173116 type:complete len:131 (-) Transcript_94500:6-398(-)
MSPSQGLRKHDPATIWEFDHLPPSMEVMVRRLLIELGLNATLGVHAKRSISSIFSWSEFECQNATLGLSAKRSISNIFNWSILLLADSALLLKRPTAFCSHRPSAIETKEVNTMARYMINLYEDDENKQN